MLGSLEKDPGYDDAWAAEIKRRIEDADSGVPGVPGDVVMGVLRKLVDDARLRVS
ncbi:MAG: hypothetical protein ABIP13_10380 [Tepidiformaceae bacterium]